MTLIHKSSIPGVPQLLTRAFENLHDTLFPCGPTFHCREFFFQSDELSLTARLDQLVRENPGVTFGSYPSWSNQYYRTKADRLYIEV